MAITQADLDQLRNEFDAKLARVTIESMNSASAIGAYGERFTAMDAQFAAVHDRFNAMDAQFAAVYDRFDGIDRRFDEMDRRLDRMDSRFDQVDRRFERLEDKFDSRFNWQTVMFASLGLLTLFGDPIRSALGL